MNSGNLLPGLALAILAPAASAADSSGRQLDTLVVTPTLTERELRETDVSISIVDALAIERQQPRDLGDLLRGQAGIDVSANGPYGKVTSFFLRGTSNSQSLLLVDGVRMGSATSGGATWQLVPPQLIERIEIVRGPRGAIYGADAVGGVVQVFTRQAGERNAFWATAGAGSFSTVDTGGGFELAGDRSSVGVAVSRFDTDGIALRPGGDRKGYDNTSWLLRGRTRLGRDAELAFIGLRSQGNTEFVGGETDFVHQSATLRLSVPLGDTWTTRLDLGEGRDEAQNISDFGPSRFDSRLRSARWLNVFDLGSHELVAGADYREDAVASSTVYDESSRDNVGVFVQGLFRLGAIDLQPALRWDDNEAYGREWTGGLTAGLPLGEGLRLRGSVGTAFRAPTFNDLYFPGFGNPDVRPESSRSFELGIGGQPGRWFWDLAAYQTDVDDLIAFRFIDGRFAAFNVEEARIRGLEAAAGVALADWTFALSYSHLDPVNRVTGLRLPRRVRDSLRLEADREFGRWSLGATAVLQGNRYNNVAATERLGGFGLLSLRAGVELAGHLSLRVTVDNVLDKDYTTARDSFAGFDFQEPGRAVFLRLRYGDR
jgi:vitamin B12 transporter